MGNARIEVFPVLVGSLASCSAVGVAHLEEVTSVLTVRVRAVVLYGEKAVKENSITSFCLQEWAQVMPLLEQTVGDKCRSG